MKLRAFLAAIAVAASLGPAASAQEMSFFRIGTGGTAGVPYLRRQLDVVLFPELWAMRTHL